MRFAYTVVAAAAVFAAMVDAQTTTDSPSAVPVIPAGFKPSLSITDGNINIDAREVRFNLKTAVDGEADNMLALSQLLADVASLKDGQAKLAQHTEYLESTVRGWHGEVSIAKAAINELDVAAAGFAEQIDQAASQLESATTQGGALSASFSERTVAKTARDKEVQLELDGIEKSATGAKALGTAAGKVFEASAEPSSVHVGYNTGEYKTLILEKEETVAFPSKKWVSVGTEKGKGQTPRVVEGIAKGRYLIKWNGRSFRKEGTQSGLRYTKGENLARLR